MRVVLAALALVIVPLVLLPTAAATEACSHVIHGYGWDKWLCHDVKGPVGCKVYWKTTWWEQGTTYDCVA